MKRLLALSVMIWSWAIFPTLSHGESKYDFMLVCGPKEKPDDYYFALGPKKGVSGYITMKLRQGTLEVSDLGYVLRFPAEKEGLNKMIVEIERYSGSYSLEFGQQPFGKFAEGNIRSYGKCEEQAIRQKF